MITEYNRALMFAASAHRGQVRKYTGEPYITHPKAVAKLVSTVTECEDVLCAAVLHDVMEDCGVTEEELLREFGPNVTSMVMQLSDPVIQGNRMVRKTAARVQLMNSNSMVQTIKLADLIHNSKTIKQYDPKFWKQYRIEKLMLLGAMSLGNKELWKTAYDQCVDGLT